MKPAPPVISTFTRADYTPRSKVRRIGPVTRPLPRLHGSLTGRGLSWPRFPFLEGRDPNLGLFLCSNPGFIERPLSAAAGRRRDHRHQRREQVAEARDVLLEHPQDIVRLHRTDVR